MKIAESTKNNYKKNSDRLLAQFNKVAAKPFEPMAFCEWMVEANFARVSGASWKQYRASVLFHIKECFPSAHVECSAYLLAHKSHNKPQGNNIRAKKKGYEAEEFSALLAFIQGRMHNPRSRGKGKIWWENLYYTLKAGDIGGLRPCEWEHARIDIAEGQCNLFIENAKTTHDRSHGPTRTINLSKLSEAEVSVIQKKIELTRDAIDLGLCVDMEDYQKHTRKYLLKANNAIFPGAKKTIATYSTRHQVVIEYKSTPGSTDEGMAAILGHASTETAQRHYGQKNKKKSSAGKLKPSKLKPDAGDLQRVAKLNAGRVPGLTKKNTPKSPPSKPTPTRGPSM